MKAPQHIDLVGMLRRLRHDPQSVPIEERLAVATAFQDATIGLGPDIPQRVLGALARVLAKDPWDEVRKRVANVLHFLDDDVLHDVLPILAEDKSAHVRAAVDRGKIRRWKRNRHAGHVKRVMSEVVKLSKEFAAEDIEAAKEKAATATAVSEELLTLDQFMRKYCKPTANLGGKRIRILSAARNGSIKLPALAAPARRGQSYSFRVSDLLEYWPHWIADGLPLPPLLKQS